jgi:hypothetical protein
VSKLKDLPTMKQISSARKAASTLVKVGRVVLPVARIVGRAKWLTNIISKADDFVQFAPGLEDLPDRFNAQFADRGWIAYETMDDAVARACVEKAERGHADEAEADLAAHYTPEAVGHRLLWMRAITAFHPRLPLAEKALEDYRAGRYYASTLVTLTLLDGLVNDLHESRKGLSAEGIVLEAWDSISAHAEGYARLARLLFSARIRTSAEKIDIPFRHGIMHGRDLGYDNQMVAAKAWAALFSTRDWAMKVERGAAAEPPPKSKKSLRESLRDYSRAHERFEEQSRMMERWKPRALQVGIDCPVSGAPTEYGEGTPERRVVEFLSYLGERKNYGSLAECFAPKIGPEITIKKLAGDYRKRFSNTNVSGFTINAITDVGPAISTVRLAITGVHREMPFTIEQEVRLLYKDIEGHLFPRQAVGGTWWMVLFPAIPGDDLPDDE